MRITVELNINNMEIPKQKVDPIVLDLLLNIQADILALRNMVLLYIPKESGETDENIENWYNEERGKAMRATLAQIKAHYLLDFDVDDFLQGLS